MDQDTVECPGCLQQFYSNLMDDTMLGIEIKTPQEETTSRTSYCPACGKRVREMDPEELLDELEALVRHRMVMEDLAKLGRVKKA